MTACPHGMPSPASCIDCFADGNLPPAPRPEPETVECMFTASRDGQCPGCNLPIMLGQTVARTTTKRRFHVGCAP